MKQPAYYVKIIRDDGSVTYKGPWGEAHCIRERDAWRESFPTYTAELVPVAVERAEVARWTKATRDDSSPRYWPEGAA